MWVKTIGTNNKDSTQVIDTQQHKEKTNNKSIENVRLKNTPDTISPCQTMIFY